jgi:hypothetical protein
MSAIDSTMLTAMRDAIGELLPDTCQVVTITLTENGQGGQTESRATASAVPFRLDVLTGREQIAGGALQPFTSYKGSLPYNTTVTTDSQLLHNSVNYAVTAVNTNQSWIAVKRVDLEKL